jgi:thioredoxin reductase (NADPH)
MMEQMQIQAEKVGTELISDMISKVDLTKRPFVALGDSGTEYTADSVIISTGAQAKWLGLENEKKFNGFGVSACATCDGFFFKDKEVAVVGGGNAAVEEALYLANIASKVHLIHRRDTLRAEKIGQDRLFKNKKINVIWNSRVIDMMGTEEPTSLTSIKLQNTVDQTETTMNIDGLFVAIGHDPATKIFEGQVEMDQENYIITKPDSTATNIPGVYAAGDVKDKIYRQAVTAAGMGCMAALEAEKFIQAQ